MTEQEHSPLPWKVTLHTHDGPWFIENATGTDVVWMGDMNDADFIVRAVNAHDALVAAVSELLTAPGDDATRHALEALQLASPKP